MPLDDLTELRRRVPGGKYALARAVAERARQLQQGDVPLVKVESSNFLSVAIDEILQGKVAFHVEDGPRPERASDGAEGSPAQGLPAVAASAPGGSLTGGEVAAPDSLDEAMAASSRNAPDPAHDADAETFVVAP